MANLDRKLELLSIPKFPDAKLEQATNHFSTDQLLGNGGFGSETFIRTQL